VSTHLVEVAALARNDGCASAGVMRGRSLALSSGRRDFVGAAVGIVNGCRSRDSTGWGGRRWLAGLRRTAARRLMPGPGLWPALAVSEQAVLDAPSNTTLQLTSGAATGMPRSAG
jgi:hypothetical protein